MIIRTKNARRVSMARKIAAAIVGCITVVLCASAQTGRNDRKVLVPPDTMPEVKPIAGEPMMPYPGTYGIDPKTGEYRYPAATPRLPLLKQMPFPGSLDYLDQNEYIDNMVVEGNWPIILNSGHTWQTIADINGRRYMYEYYMRTGFYVYDITDPKNLKVVIHEGPKPELLHPQLGAMTIKWHQGVNKLIAIQCFQSPRFHVLGAGEQDDKFTHPENAHKLREYVGRRGFTISEVTDPDPRKWKLLADVPMDPYHRDPKTMPQQGSGCMDVPTWFGGKYMFLAGTPDDTFANTEYRSVLYAPINLAYDVSDPSNPKLAGTWWIPGQRLGEEEAYRKNSRYGNRSSWMGARQSMLIPRPVEKGGKYGYSAMGGYGFYVIDISDPSNMKTVGHVEMPLSISGNEGDNIEPSKIESTGIAYYAGYPLNEDCFEPEKPIFAVDVKDPANPRVVGKLPRPKPPGAAPFTDFCQRRGIFGPKRPGYPHLSPGTPNPNYLIYSYYNAGVQLFDVRDPLKPSIAAYFTPRMADPKLGTDLYHYTVRGVFIEWDRNLVWAFTSTGIYLLSSPALGNPVLGMPAASAAH